MTATFSATNTNYLHMLAIGKQVAALHLLEGGIFDVGLASREASLLRSAQACAIDIESSRNLS